MPNLPIFVISLARAAERRSNIAAHLRKIGADFEIVDAVDGKAMTPSEIAAVVDPGVSFHPGVIGCYLSHINVYKMILNNDLCAALIIEDDVVIKQTISKVSLSDIPYTKFDYFYLDCVYPPNTDLYFDHNDSLTIRGVGTGYRLNVGPASTYGYIITKESAAKRLQFAIPIKSPIDLHKDDDSKIRFYSMVRPDIAAIENDDSLESLTRHNQVGKVRLRSLKQTRLYFHFRNLLHPSMLARRRKVAALRQQGALPAHGDWRPLPDGRIFPDQ